MSLYLDTAVLGEIEPALEHGVLVGVTTNPTLVAAALRMQEAPEPETRVSEERLYREILARLSPVQRLYVQVTGGSPREIVEDAGHWCALDASRVVVKIPATWAGIAAIPLIKSRLGAPVCVTAVFSAEQAYIAALAGADQIAVYVNRYARAGGRVGEWLPRLRAVLTKAGGGVRILAASLKTPSEAGDALVSGADDLTLPPRVLHALMENELTADALQRFEEDHRRVNAFGADHRGASHDR